MSFNLHVAISWLIEIRKILLIMIKYSRVSRGCDRRLRLLREGNFFAQGIEGVGNHYYYEREEEYIRMKYQWNQIEEIFQDIGRREKQT